MIRLKLEGVEIQLNKEKWSCRDNKDLANILSAHYTYDLLEEYSAFPDLKLAKLTMKELGGKIIEVINPPKSVEGRIY